MDGTGHDEPTAMTDPPDRPDSAGPAEAGLRTPQHASLDPGTLDPDQVDPEAFERLVIGELDALPDEMVAGLENLVFITQDRPEDGSLDILGLYDGVALTRRENYGLGELPDRIILYREPLLAACATLDELKEQIRITLVHEIAHFYGIDDDQLHDLGWG